MRTAFDWCGEARAKLARAESLVALGRGDALLDGGGCTDPGGGIFPVQRTARETAELMRQLIAQSCGGPPATGVSRGGYPVPGFTLGDPPRPSRCACEKVTGGDLSGPAAAASVGMSPLALALTTSVVGAATGWVIEEIASRVRGRRRR